MPTKPFSQACENNKGAILKVLAEVFAPCKKVVEIGSGSGQHAAHFAQNMRWLDWQPTDQQEYLPGIEAWRADSQLANFLPPALLDVRTDSLPQPIGKIDALFTANTFHIMHWASVQQTFELLEALNAGTRLCVYGPFNYGGEFTSPSNARFNQWLQDRDAGSAIRDAEEVDQLARSAGFSLQCDYSMPANNRLLYWEKT